jgi:spore germination protein KB
MVYTGLLEKSSNTFPIMLEEHLGKIAGKILAIIYIAVFALLSILYLRFYEEFIINNVLLGSPVSALLMIIVIPGFYAIYCGTQVMARVSEIVFIVAFPLAILLLLAGMTEKPDFANLLPLTNISPVNLLEAVYLNTWHVGNMVLILALYSFCQQNVRVIKTMLIRVTLVLVLYLSTEMLVILIVLGADLTATQSFPLFEIARNIELGGFIRNLEVFFISSFIMGICISVTIFWFMACYCTQKVFNLKDYRFLAAPAGIIIAFGSILISPNTFWVFSILEKIAPIFFGVFFVLIPILLYLIALIKSRLAPGTKA